MFKPGTPLGDAKYSTRMSSTIQGSFFDKSPKTLLCSTLDTPIRYKNFHVSPALKGGNNINAAKFNHPVLADAKEHARNVGFGPGMGSALIGNNNRLGGAKFIMPCAPNSHRT
jgi:hypothetical protein